jgi:predicted Zn-dependent peptidase
MLVLQPCAVALRRGLLSAALLAAGCAGSVVVGPKPAPPLGLGFVREGRGAGPDLALIARPSGELVELALWIDVGARDAEAPQVATLAAWLAAQAAGPEVHGTAWPDGTELAMTCKRSQLAACLAQLARGLALRALDPARMQVAVRRLIDAQRAAAAADPQRDADLLALRGLYGDAAATGFVPLPRTSDDSLPSSAQVQAFLADHFGPERSLVIAAGDLDVDALEGAVARAFAKAKPASQARASTRAPPNAEPGVNVEVGNSDALSVAMAATDLTQAHRAAAALQARLERSRLVSAIRGNVFLVRGGGLVLLRMQTRNAAAVVRAVGGECARNALEGAPAVVAQPAGEDLAALTRRLGMRWTTQGEAQSVEPCAIGIGVLVRGGRADRLASPDPDAPLREKSRAELEAALRAGLALGHPTLAGPIDAQTASVTLENGARIEARQRAGEQVAIAVRFTPGAAADAPLLHGRAALLATLTTTACAGMQASELQARLRALGATLEPEVSGDSWGVMLTAPAVGWQPALALALDCALHPTLDRATLSAARLRLLERLGPKDGPGALLAATAAAIMPAAPGMLSPWGSRARQASVTLRSLDEFARTSLTGSAVRVGVAGPIVVDDAIGLTARRLVELESAQALPTVRSKTPNDPPSAADPQPQQATLGLALVHVTMPGGHPAGALAFAALLRSTLGRLPGVSATWHAGGVVRDTGWAAVALVGAPDALAGAATALTSAVEGLSGGSLERAADQAFGLATHAEAVTAAEPRTEARALCATGETGTALPVPAEAARALAKHLAREIPAWLPLR